MEDNQSVYVVVNKTTIIEDIVTKVTKRVITLASGKRFNSIFTPPFMSNWVEIKTALCIFAC